jgi:hypothetical protein
MSKEISAMNKILPTLLLWILAAGFIHADFTREVQFSGDISDTDCLAWGNCNNDGYLDMFVGNGYLRQSYFYINNQDLSFTERPFNDSTDESAAAWGDFDNDGDLDLAVGRWGNTLQNYIYLNNGQGGFPSKIPFGHGDSTNSVAWGDYDNDGNLDLASANLRSPCFVYINNGDGTLAEVILEYDEEDAHAFVVAWGDYDHDGDLDLAVARTYDKQNSLYVNLGDGTFQREDQFGGGWTISLAWGDYDNDGDLDMAVGNVRQSDTPEGQNYLYINNGNGTFTEEEQFGTGKTFSVAWGDYDNDGDLDMAVGNAAQEFPGAQNYLYVNNGDKSFTRMKKFGIENTWCMAWGDYDNDGDLDLGVGNCGAPGLSRTNYLYINNENDQDYLRLHLVGHFHDHGNGYSNRNGIGAKVFIYEEGHLENNEHLLGFREVEANGGHCGQDAMDAAFGIPSHDKVDILIRWPGSDGFHLEDTLLGVVKGQSLVVHEGSPGHAHITVGPGPAYMNPPRVRVFPSDQDAAWQYEFNAYGSGHYGVHVSCGNVDSGHLVEVLTGAGPGGIYGPHVRGFRMDGKQISGLSFLAYGTSKYGVHVAAGDLDDDGFDEVITGAGPGPVFGPHVRAFNYDDGPAVTPAPGVSYFAYGTRKWGVHVTGGDIDGDGYDEIVTGAGPGPVFGPHVRGWNIDGGKAAAIPDVSFFAYGTRQYGVKVSGGNVDCDACDEIITAPGPCGYFSAHIRGWNYDGALVSSLPGCSFMAWPASGVTYGANIYARADLDMDSRDEIVVGAGPDPDIGSPVRAFQYDGTQTTLWFSLHAFPAGWTHGANVTAMRY